MIGRLRHSRRGAAAVEAALLFALFLAPLTTIVIESWSRARAYERLEDGVNALILKVGHQTSAWNDAATLNPILTAASGSGVTWNVTDACFCVPDLIRLGKDAQQKSCNATCSDGLRPARFGIYTTSLSYTPIVEIPGMSGGNFTATGRVRLE